MQTHSFVISHRHHEQPLDLALVALLPDFSRRKVRRILDHAGIRINDKVVHIASWKVQNGDRITVSFEEDTLSLRTFAYDPAWILYHRDGYLVVNKPPHLPSQQTKNPKGTHVIKFLKAQDPKLAPTPWVLCHRLDQETSGALILAASNPKATWITDQFKARTVKKKYWALCYGIPAKKDWEVKGHLSVISAHTGRVSVVKSGGRSAHTRFRCVASNEALGLSLIECEPLTGRSHQIRIHLQECRLGLVGDKKYGMAFRKKLPFAWGKLTQDHHLLHAGWVSFCPKQGGLHIDIRAPFPPNFSLCCEMAGFSLPS